MGGQNERITLKQDYDVKECQEDGYSIRSTGWKADKGLFNFIELKTVGSRLTVNAEGTRRQLVEEVQKPARLDGYSHLRFKDACPFRPLSFALRFYRPLGVIN